MDSDLENIKLVLGDASIDANNHFACGDIKEIFSLKIHR